MVFEQVVPDLLKRCNKDGCLTSRVQSRHGYWDSQSCHKIKTLFCLAWALQGFFSMTGFVTGYIQMHGGTILAVEPWEAGYPESESNGFLQAVAH